MARSQPVFEEVIDSVEQLSLAISTTNNNLKDANAVLNQYQHSHVKQNDHIRELRDDLNRCMEMLNLNYRNVIAKDIATASIEPPLATSTPITNQTATTTRDSGIPTETQSTKRISRSKEGVIGFDKWLQSIRDKEYEISQSQTPLSRCSILSGSDSVSLNDEQDCLNKLERWKKKVYKTIRKWKEKCGVLEAALKIEENKVREEERRNAELNNRCFQLEVLLEGESVNCKRLLAQYENKSNNEQKELKNQIDELKKMVAEMEKLHLKRTKEEEQILLDKEIKFKKEVSSKIKDCEFYEKQINILRTENQHYGDCLFTLDKEIELIIGLLCFQSTVPFQTFLNPVEPLPANIKLVVANMKCKLRWITEETHKIVLQNIHSNHEKN